MSKMCPGCICPVFCCRPKLFHLDVCLKRVWSMYVWIFDIWTPHLLWVAMFPAFNFTLTSLTISTIWCTHISMICPNLIYVSSHLVERSLIICETLSLGNNLSFLLNLSDHLFLFECNELTDIFLLDLFFCSITKVLASGSYWCLGKSSVNSIQTLSLLKCLSPHWSSFRSNINYPFYTEIICTVLFWLLTGLGGFLFFICSLRSDELSHMLYAAADMVLVPSIYEPCGLTQMIGMRYGAVCT